MLDVDIDELWARVLDKIRAIEGEEGLREILHNAAENCRIYGPGVK